MASDGIAKAPQTTGALPIDKPPVSPEKRLEYTKQLLGSVHHAKPLDSNFDPVQATPEELESHGLPPRPGDPDQAAAWVQLVSELKSKKLVIPTFEIIQRAGTMGRPEATKWTGYNWAGAVIRQSNFYYTKAEWTVPRPDPGRGDNEAWYSSAYVGLDGWTSDDVLAGGTGHDVYKALGQISRRTYAWYEWYPAYPIKLIGFPVNIGDRVLCIIWAPTPRTACFFIYNRSTGQYSTFYFDAPPGTQLQGDSAEWIVEGDQPETNFHRVEFDDCWALKRSGAWLNLTAAEVVLSVCEDGTVCTAEIKDPTTLVVTYQAR